MDTLAAGEKRAAWASAFACYLIWGFVPLFMQAAASGGGGAFEILGHRIVWGCLTGLVVVLIAKQGRQVLRILREPKTLGMLALSATVIAANWVVFIFAVNDGRTMETALGYYLNPLISMAAGALIFRERLNRIALLAIALAVIGVAIQAVALGHAPWVSLILGVSFAVYGVIRKKVAADAQSGFLIETLLLAPVALAYVVWLEGSGDGHLFSGFSSSVWLLAAGPVTAAPLLLFAWAARRLPLSLMGFLQFMAPTISFLIAVAQGEPFTPLRAVSFGFIWLGAGVFMFGLVRAARALRAAQA